MNSRLIEELRRSVLFVFVTGEEKGLLGLKYFAAHPTVDPQSMIANINTDMFLPIIPLKVMVIQGLAESTSVNAAPPWCFLGVKPIADPLPLHNSFGATTSTALSGAGPCRGSGNRGRTANT